MEIHLPLWVTGINCLLVKGSAGWQIIDTGLGEASTKTLWQQTLAGLHIKPQEVREIFVTHLHIDHFGCAGFLQELTGGKVLIADTSEAFPPEQDCDYPVTSARLDQILGLSVEGLEAIKQKKTRQFRQWYIRPRSWHHFAEKQVLLGDYLYEVLHLPGHSDCQMCFYNLETGVFIGGDILVPPNSLHSPLSNPVKDYFATLKFLQQFEIKCFIPSHGKAFQRANIRIGLIEDYRKGQLEQILARVNRLKAMTVFEVWNWLLAYGGLKDEYFGMGETYYFLEYLVHERLLTKEISNDKFYYIKR